MAEKKTKKKNKNNVIPADKSDNVINTDANSANEADKANQRKQGNQASEKDNNKSLDIFDMTCQVNTSDSEIEDIDLTANLIETRGSVKIVSQKDTHDNPAPKKPSKVDLEAVTEDDDDIHRYTIPSRIGIMALRNIVLFPGIVVPLGVGRPHSQALLKDLDAQSGTDKVFAVVTQIDQNIDNPRYEDVYAVGTIVAVLKTINMPDGNKTVVVHGLMRFKVKKWITSEPYLQAEIEPLPPKKNQKTIEMEAQINSINNMAERIIQLSPNIPEEVQVIMQNIDEPGPLADFLAGNIHFSQEEKQGVLEAYEIKERLTRLSVAMANQLEMLELSEKIQSKVHQSIDKNQREYFLHEQLKAIQKELGQEDGSSSEVRELEEKIANACMPATIEEEAKREL